MEIVEVLADLRVLVLAGGLEVVSQELREEHLPDPDHASPAGVSDEGGVISAVLEQLGEAGAVGDPDDVPEGGCDAEVGLVYVGRVGLELPAQQVRSLIGSQGCLKGVFLKYGNCLVLEVVGEVLDALGEVQRTGVGFHQK